MNIGIWSGDVKLRDLELRKDALDQLKLPVNVVEGYLGQLSLQYVELWTDRFKRMRVNFEKDTLEQLEEQAGSGGDRKCFRARGSKGRAGGM